MSEEVRPSGANPTVRREGVPRRTIVKGAAWSVPVIAAAVRAPLAAASGCLSGDTVTVVGNGATLVTRTVAIPACATKVTYTVKGGDGQRIGSTSIGRGATISGELKNVAGLTLTLVAGGSPNSGATDPRPGGAGYGNGGNGYGSVGAGGAGSAILVAGNPVVVAGGGGGGTNVYLTIGSSVVVTAITAMQDGVDAGTGSSSSSTPTGYGLRFTKSNGDHMLTAGGGAGAAGAAGGAAAPAAVLGPGVTATDYAGSAGGAHGTGNLGGGNGGDGPPIGAGTGTTGLGLGVNGGGGGGGWAGGGGGRAYRVTGGFPSGTNALDGGSAGGAGSSHVDAVAAPPTAGPAPRGDARGDGSVTITWS